jgi:hypothetical protein
VSAAGGRSWRPGWRYPPFRTSAARGEHARAATSNGGDELIAELDATSPASIRELLEALAELRSGGANELTRTLLGGAD